MESYNHKEVEEKWKSIWFENNLYEAVDFSDKPKKYILAEFPYPSGKALHAGHMMRYTVPDVYSRYLRMNGYNVLFPLGWDAFGLPAENYAIKTGQHPSKLTDEIIKDYKDSVIRMGYGIDWKREIKTTDPNYYKWTQWIFLKFYKEGLAEYKEAPIWWCEKLKTVLADEEVVTDKDGNKVSERERHPVEKKMLKQWILKIREYADKLLDGLDQVDFPEAIKSAQANWIGKSKGATIRFKCISTEFEVFTTRPDTLFGITFIAIAPEHPLIDILIKDADNEDEIKNYIDSVSTKSDLERVVSKEKTGVQMKGLEVEIPIVGRKVPVYIADYVLMDYGTGVVMGVPAHDVRDFEFADKFDLDIIKVIEPKIKEDVPFENEGIVINSDKYNGLESKEFKQAITRDLEKLNLGKLDVQYKIRDWVFSRQRYWGEPIPLLHLEDGSTKPICDPDDSEQVKEKLPLKLPELPDYSPTSDGLSPLARDKSWVEVNFDEKKAERETNTMPNWAGSCWYYIRYTDPNNDSAFADFERMSYWLPVDKYFGGIEHTTMHLLYSRFWHKFLYDEGLVPTPEPYKWRMNGGILLGEDGKKMSKSAGNVVEPMGLVDKYGADSLRMSVLFLGPYEETYPWNSNSIKATNKLINTIYILKTKVTKNPPSNETLKNYHKMVKNVTKMIEGLKMNTCISEFMIFTNSIRGCEEINEDIFKGFIKLLSPFAPFLSEELWQQINNYTDWKKENSVHVQPWPTYDKKLVENDTVTLPIQINGKVRSEIEVATDESEGDVKEKSLSDKKIQKYLVGKEPKKFIYIKNRIVNIVI